MGCQKVPVGTMGGAAREARPGLAPCQHCAGSEPEPGPYWSTRGCAAFWSHQESQKNPMKCNCPIEPLTTYSGVKANEVQRCALQTFYSQ